LFKKNHIKKTWGERVFDVAIVVFFIAMSVVFIYPFINILVVSLNDPYDAMRGGLYFWPRDFSVENYKQVLKDPQIYTGYAVTIARTVIGSLTHVFCTSMFAYGLSKKNLKFKTFYSIFCFIPMFFGGGLVPSYLLRRSLGLLNSFWGVYIIPGLYSMWNAMIFKTSFSSLPSSLEEAAKIDGCNDFGVFFRVILPLSKATIAAILLFQGVSHWNQWFDAYIYITDEKLLPLQTVLMRIINQSAAMQAAEAEAQVVLDIDSASKATPESIRYATMVVTIGPIILLYPFLQKYFEKGVLVGSVKG